jgi:F-type H+-transporting ATPase subunit gamma
METLEGLQRTIAATRELKSIVRTMKVLSAVSIRQYERAEAALEDYRRSVEMGLAVVAEQTQREPQPKPPDSSVGVGAVIFGSDQGLCGRFNETIGGFARNTLAGIAPRPEERRVLTVGARVAAFLEIHGEKIDECIAEPASVTGITPVVQRTLLTLGRWREGGTNRVLLFYNEHRSGVVHDPVAQELLPIDFAKIARQGDWPPRSLPTFTMTSESLLAALVRQHLFIGLFRACTESLASEHASRLVAMQVAERNIEERLETLNARFRQQRQNKITEELLDVVAGFEALMSGRPRVRGAEANGLKSSGDAA